MYLYVWYLLAVLAWLLRRMDNAFGWAVFSGAYGLCFGGLCAAVYLVAKTPAFALSWWLSGLSYDVMHGAGNFVIMLLLYRPLRTALQRRNGRSGYNEKGAAAYSLRHRASDVGRRFAAASFVILKSFPAARAESRAHRPVSVAKAGSRTKLTAWGSVSFAFDLGAARNRHPVMNTKKTVPRLLENVTASR